MRRRAATIVLVASTVLLMAATKGLTVTGSIEGDLAKGSTATLRIHVTEPQGLERLQEIRATLLLRNIPIVVVGYAPAFRAITVVGGAYVPLGSPQVLSTSFFHTSGGDVTETIAGDRLDLAIRLHLTQDLPAGSQFSFSVSDSLGASSSFTADAAVPRPSTGFSWGFVLTLVLAVFLLGGFVGSLFASRRLNRPRASIYDVIRQRIELERTGAPV
jgi:hypothetical protein